MILLPCPHCGFRNSSEFRYVGEQRPRPNPNETGVEEWRTYLYGRSNRAGWVMETWFHRAGCGRYLTVERHTISNDVRAAHRPAAQLRNAAAEGATRSDVPTDPGGTTP